MSHQMSNGRFLVIAAALVLCTAAIVVLSMRECYCETCPESRPTRYAIWMRDARQVCRSCKTRYDRRNRQKRALPWRRAS